MGTTAEEAYSVSLGRPVGTTTVTLDLSSSTFIMQLATCIRAISTRREDASVVISNEVLSRYLPQTTDK